jgi:hypothetical protein
MTGAGLRETARALGISHVRLLALARQGKAPRHPDGSFDVAKVRAALADTLDPNQASRVKAAPAAAAPTKPAATAVRGNSMTGDLTYVAARTKHEIAKAEKAALEAALLRGLLVKNEDVKAVVGKMISTVRQKFLTIGHKLAPALAVETDTLTCQALIDDAVNEALQELTEWRPQQS